MLEFRALVRSGAGWARLGAGPARSSAGLAPFGRDFLFLYFDEFSLDFKSFCWIFVFLLDFRALVRSGAGPARSGAGLAPFVRDFAARTHR